MQFTTFEAIYSPELLARGQRPQRLTVGATHVLPADVRDRAWSWLDPMLGTFGTPQPLPGLYLSGNSPAQIAAYEKRYGEAFPKRAHVWVSPGRNTATLSVPDGIFPHGGTWFHVAHVAVFA